MYQAAPESNVSHVELLIYEILGDKLALHNMKMKKKKILIVNKLSSFKVKWRKSFLSLIIFIIFCNHVFST